MRIERLTLGPVLCIAAATLGFLGFLSQRALSREAARSETARSISTMSLSDRMHLPDSTMVKLNSGRTVSLGTLRAQHNTRMARFSRAAALGGSVAAKLATQQAGSITLKASSSTQKPGSIQQNPPLANVHPAPAPGSKGTGGMTRANTSVSAGSNVALPVMVPFHPTAAGVPLAKDYVDFCKAARPTVCIYVPPDTAFQNAGAGLEYKVMRDLDPLIVDKSVCEFGGGVLDIGIPTAGCVFYYPYKSLANFRPTGPVTTNASCDLPGRQVVDPKGAVQAWFEYPGLPFATDAKPITCVVQVWVSP